MYLQPRCCPRCSSSNVHLLLVFHLDVPQVPQANVQLEFAIFPHKTNPQPRLSISSDWHPRAQAEHLSFLLATSSPHPAAPISHQVLWRLQPASLTPATQAVVLELPSASLPWVVSGLLIRPSQPPSTPSHCCQQIFPPNIHLCPSPACKPPLAPTCVQA